MLKWLSLGIAILACSCAALAQDGPSAAPSSAGGPSQPAAVPAAGSESGNGLCNCVVIPALTPVTLELLAPVGSKISTTGDRFAIALKAPIVIGDREVIPAGATGEGEVVHAKKAGGSGAAGELVLAARFLAIGDRTLRLRSMRVAVAGRDAIHTVDAINAASAVSPLPVGLLGFAITGRNVEMPKGTIAVAKTAETFPVELGDAAVQEGKNETNAEPSRQDTGQ